MPDTSIAANADEAAIIDAADAGFSLTIVGEPHLAGLRKVFDSAGTAIAGAVPLAFTHGLDVVITRAAIRQHVECGLRDLADAEAGNA